MTYDSWKLRSDLDERPLGDTEMEIADCRNCGPVKVWAQECACPFCGDELPGEHL